MTSSRLIIKILNEEINKLRQKIEEIDLLKLKVKNLEIDLEDVKRQNTNTAKPRNDLKNTENFRKKKVKPAKCKVCSKVFSKNSLLEVHFKADHKEVEKYQCEKYNMTCIINPISHRNVIFKSQKMVLRS